MRKIRKKSLKTQLTKENDLTNPYKYKSISLKNSTYQKLTNLTKELIPGVHLSGAKAVEVMIDKVSSSEGPIGTTNETTKKTT